MTRGCLLAIYVAVAAVTIFATMLSIAGPQLNVWLLLTGWAGVLALIALTWLLDQDRRGTR